MSHTTHLSVPRYVYRSVERALTTAKNRAKLAAQRVERLEDTLATMRTGKNGEGANDNTENEEDEESEKKV